ncbi:protein FLOURY 1-like [Actinidia eriantha]|uniref:protein FLOURY 1-like n=1 Tax=Actinidia eriantha TaxID=165200 RepID=UPI00258F3AAB|nr:protein FLOURY 1-like [Actinidia eriantha]
MDSASCFKFLSQNSYFGCGFLVFGCFRQLFNVLGLLFLFGLGFRILQFGNYFMGLIQFLSDFRGKSTDLRNGFCSKICFHGKPNSYISSACGLLEFWENSEPSMTEKLEEIKEIENTDSEFDEDSNEHECYDEDEEIDVMELRKLVKIERKRANAAYSELEKERTAAATAAEEAMGMILRLQNEKSLVEMEANQYRRLSEEKQIHDQGVIQSLRWIVMKHESERSLLEGQLRVFRRKSKLCVEGGDEGAKFEEFDESLRFFNLNSEGSPGDALISSLDMDLSPDSLLYVSDLGVMKENFQNDDSPTR